MWTYQNQLELLHRATVEAAEDFDNKSYDLASAQYLYDCAKQDNAIAIKEYEDFVNSMPEDSSQEYKGDI